MNFNLPTLTCPVPTQTYRLIRLLVSECEDEEKHFGLKIGSLRVMIIGSPPYEDEEGQRCEQGGEFVIFTSLKLSLALRICPFSLINQSPALLFKMKSKENPDKKTCIIAR
ncbi:MAG: hypothetical protein KQH63_04355 [Desulfobulbaceae bacterium]|nr:hypothetical protein [Desulfobulbaceae bacterium]